MATQVPFSNPAGNNQTNPTNSVLPKPIGTPVPGGGGSAPANPYMPPAHPVAAGGTGSQDTKPLIPGGMPQTGANQGFITNSSSYASGENDLQKQLIDIYGKGVGGSLFTLLNSMSGTDSKILQEYIASLQPQMAKAQANTNAALGAGGVSANSSVAAIADSNLQAQEFSAIASESAALTQHQEQLTAEILTGAQGAASKEVATSGWSVFADVMNQITGDIGNLVGGHYQHTGPQATQAKSSVSGSDSGSVDYGGTPIPTGLDEGESAAASLEAFA